MPHMGTCRISYSKVELEKSIYHSDIYWQASNIYTDNSKNTNFKFKAVFILETVLSNTSLCPRLRLLEIRFSGHSGFIRILRVEP